MNRLPAQGYPRRASISTRVGLALVALLILHGMASSGAEASYGHIRTVEGPANLLSGGSEPAIEATPNYPIQVGDRILVSTGGRLEVVLPDGSLLRLDGNSELQLARLARSSTSEDDQNLVRLLQGEIQASVTSEPSDPGAFQIDTANASLFLLSEGSYRVFTDGRSWTEVIVREGYAEVVTERGTERLGVGQQALIDGDRSPKVTIQAAPSPSGLEQWARRIDAEADTVEAQVPYRRGYVSPTLGYAAASLHRHGRWISYRDRYVWRPHVGLGWRPYHSGWWIYTPAGMTWVSTEPWGWVPYHYGTWGFAGGIGWVWYPGYQYTPGAVYWYWGPTHVGWIPSGYYSGYWGSPYCAVPPYGYFGGSIGHPHHPGRGPHVNPLPIHAGAGGDVSHWRDWTFTSYDRFGYRDSHRFVATGAELEHRGVFQREIPRGVLTTETRRLTPNLWQEPQRVVATLESPASTRPRTTRLSPLGEAALSGSSSRPRQPDARELTRSGRRETRARQWDPALWRREQRSRPRSVAPYRRDTRTSSSFRSGTDSSAQARQPYRRQTRSNLSGRSQPSGSRYTRPSSPRPGGRAIGGSRSPASPPRSGLGQGRSPAGGRSSVGTPGRGSGSGRPGRSNKGGVSRPSSPGDGSG